MQRRCTSANSGEYPPCRASPGSPVSDARGLLSVQRGPDRRTAVVHAKVAEVVCHDLIEREALRRFSTWTQVGRARHPERDQTRRAARRLSAARLWAPPPFRQTATQEARWLLPESNECSISLHSFRIPYNSYSTALFRLFARWLPRARAASRLPVEYWLGSVLAEDSPCAELACSSA